MKLTDLLPPWKMLGKRGAAIDFLNGVIAERPEKLELRKRLADLYVRNHRISDAVAQLDTIADALLNAGNQQGAIMMLQTIISLNPPILQNIKPFFSGFKIYKQNE